MKWFDQENLVKELCHYINKWNLHTWPDPDRENQANLKFKEDIIEIVRKYTQ